MNKRTSIKGKESLMAIFALPLLVAFSLSTISPEASIQVNASGYDLPIGDHEGVPSKEVFKTVNSDYNPSGYAVKKGSNTANNIEHGYYYGKLSTAERKDLYDAIYIACNSARRLKKSAALPDSKSEADVVNKGGYLFYSGSTSRERYYNADTLECNTVVNETIEALCYDHMTNVEFYMCNWNIYEFKTDDVYKDYIIMQEYTDDNYDELDKKVVSKAKEYANKVKSLGLVSSTDVAATVLNVHDWYTKQVEYGSSQKTGSTYFNLSHTAYGSLCQGHAVCDGYSQGYALILKELGIDSKVITGVAQLKSGNRGGHAWNIVNIDGDWYEEDTTWADTKVTGDANSINHAYYNKTTAQYYAGIEDNKHLREAPFLGRVTDKAYGTKYTYEASLELTGGQTTGNTDSGNDGSGNNNTDNSNSGNSNTANDNTGNNQNNSQSGNQESGQTGNTSNDPTDNSSTEESSTENVVVNDAPDANGNAETAQAITCVISGSQTAAVSGVKDKAESVVTIPATVLIEGKEYSVTSIEPGAFKDNNNLQELHGGVNLTSIGREAFSNCKNLNSVDLSDSDIHEIGKKAFNGCKKLKKIKLNGEHIKKIGAKAFNKLNKNVRITIFSKNRKTYKKLVTKVTKAGAKKAHYKYKKELGIKYT